MTFMPDAKAFRRHMGQVIGNPAPNHIAMQIELIREEFVELQKAFREETKAEQLKELADLVYVAYQLAAAMDWNLDIALDRVHKSNMSKLVNGVPLRREDGKILKGPNYQPPDVGDLV